MEKNIDCLEKAKKVHSIYIAEYYAFPKWVLDPLLWSSFAFDKTVVYYDAADTIDDVQLMVKQREPCNISMQRIYDEEKMEQAFGWRHGAYYNHSTTEKLMPNIAIYCYATVLRESGDYKKIHVINLVGYAFDNKNQPDYKYFATKPTEHLVGFYHRMWRKAYFCALDLKRQQPAVNKIKIFNVGGGAFAGRFGCGFIETVFGLAFLPLLPFFEKAGIQVLGYDTETKTFNGGYVPQILDTDHDVENTLYVNAWDPFSLIGNGNEADNSLDGYWGRCSNMAVLGWSETNPSLQYREC